MLRIKEQRAMSKEQKTQPEIPSRSLFTVHCSLTTGGCL